MYGAIHPLLQYVFMAWWLIKHRDNFTFTKFNFYPYANHYRNDNKLIININSNI
jgi:hypothetical protein